MGSCEDFVLVYFWFRISILERKFLAFGDSSFIFCYLYCIVFCRIFCLVDLLKGDNFVKL